MLKGYRGPALALIAAIILLVLVIATRPATEVSPTPAPQQAALPTSTPLPTIAPVSTIPFQKLDTATLNEAFVGCIKKLNPLLAGYNQADLDVSSLIFEGLTTTNEYGAAVPELATSVAPTNDG